MTSNESWKSVTCAIACVECPSLLTFFRLNVINFLFYVRFVDRKASVCASENYLVRNSVTSAAPRESNHPRRKVNLISVLSELATLLINKQVFHLIRIDRKCTRTKIEASRAIHSWLPLIIECSVAVSESQEIGDEIITLSLLWAMSDERFSQWIFVFM